MKRFCVLRTRTILGGIHIWWRMLEEEEIPDKKTQQIRTEMKENHDQPEAEEGPEHSHARYQCF